MTVSAQSAGPEPVQQVPLTSILTDAACQAPVKIRAGVVRDYRRAMAEQISVAGTAAAFASLSVFEAVEKAHAQLAELVDQLAQSSCGGAFQQHLVRKLKDGKLKFCSPALNIFIQKLGSAVPYCGHCPRCHARHPGRAHPACQLCGGRGWLSQRDFELCPTSERNELGRLRA